MIIIPACVKAHKSPTDDSRVIIKYANFEGWDIVAFLTDFNCDIDVIEFCKRTNLGVYCDHIMVDAAAVDLSLCELSS
jgi:hypothetical protein